MNLRFHTAFVERASGLLVWALVFSIPFEKSVWISGLGTISRALGIVALAAVGVTAVRRRSLGPPNIALLTAAAFVLWTGLTFFWSLAPDATWGRLVTFGQLFAMLWLIWYWCRQAPGRRERLMMAYVAGTAVSAILGLARYAAGYQTNYRRYAAAGFDPNDLGLTMALSIPLALYLAFGARGGAAWLYRAGVALAIASILLTASRSAFLASGVAFSFAFLVWRESSWTQRVSSVALLGLLLLGAWRLAPAASRQRLATLPAEMTSGTLHNRTQIWKAGLRAFKGHRMAGVGAGAYPKAVEPWLGKPVVPGHEDVAHNTFLSILVEEGVMGAGLFALLLASLALFIWVLPRRQRRLWSVTLMVWAVGVSTLTWEHRKPTWLIFGLIVAAWSRSFDPAKEGA